MSSMFSIFGTDVIPRIESSTFERAGKPADWSKPILSTGSAYGSPGCAVSAILEISQSGKS